MKKLFLLCLALAVGLLMGCQPPPQTPPVELTILQLNDVYEISPLSGGAYGGLARVATLRKKLAAENANLLTVMAGDFLSPSVFGAIKQDGQRIKGMQMIETLNAMGLDVATFGNHEFDLKEAELQARIDASAFTWTSANVFHATDADTLPFTHKGQPIAATYIFEAKGEDDQVINVGVIGLTLGQYTKPYLHITDVMAAAETAIAALKPQTDLIVALTHQDLADDLKLAERFPELALIMGGHEHDHRFQQVNQTPVAKAHANARSVYIHRLTVNPADQSVSVASELKEITPELADDPATAAVIQKWQQVANQQLEKDGFTPDAVVFRTEGEPLDGLEVSVRSKPTNLATMIVESMAAVAPNTNLAVLNGGSIRVDDKLSGDITQFDVMRILPFGGGIREVQIRGEKLADILRIGRENAGKGGYLHFAGFTHDGQQWLANDKPLDMKKTYTVAFTDFLLTGRESGLDFLTPETEGIAVVGKQDTAALQDIRKALIDYWLAQQPAEMQPQS